MKITYFHRNLKSGYSINKVSQTFIREILDKDEFYVPCLGASLSKVIKNIWFIFRHRSKNGINHITGDIHYGILALLGTKSVVTFHDTGMVDNQQFGFFKHLLLEWLWVRIPAVIATKVVCISGETKKHIQKYVGRKDIVVIHNAVDPSFKTVLKDQSESPYNVLLIGTGYNKNLERTVPALQGIDCKLTIIGKLSCDQEIMLRDSKINYDNKFNLSDDEVRIEYEKSDVVSFISLFEGFGMPVIEAQKVGRPVITSSIPVLKEVGGDACVYVDPENVDDMHNGFVKLFSDAELRKQCVERGLENVKRFELEEILSEWNNLYNSLSK